MLGGVRGERVQGAGLALYSNYLLKIKKQKKNSLYIKSLTCSYLITGGVNYMLFSVKLVGDYNVGVYICRRRIVTKHMRNTSKAYVHSTQGLIMFSLLWYN